METDLDELKRLEKAATPGPWHQYGETRIVDDGLRPVVFPPAHLAPSASDTALIAALRNAAPALIAEVKQARADAAELLALRKLREAAEAREKARSAVMRAKPPIKMELAREYDAADNAELLALAACRKEAR